MVYIQNMVITIEQIEKDTLVLELGEEKLIEVRRALISGTQESLIYDIKKCVGNASTYPTH